MKKFFSFCLAALTGVLVMGQEPAANPSQRTPEEEARKQTIRLTRELGIKDSIRIDTLYRMHLKYARIRQKGLTRAQNRQRMEDIYAELKKLLTPEEFEKFMNHPAEQPRRPHGANVLTPAKPQQPAQHQ